MPKIPGAHNTTLSIWVLIINKAEAGLPHSEIANFINCSTRTIDHILKHAKERGHNEDAPNSGRPSKVNDRTIRHIKIQMEGNCHQTLSDITSTINHISPSPISKWTIQHILHNELDMNSCVAAKKPFLSKVHRMCWLNWACQHRAWKLTDWSSVIWTDESSVEIGKDSRRTLVWRRPGERYMERCLAPTFKSGRSSLMVWGCIAYGRLAHSSGSQRTRGLGWITHIWYLVEPSGIFIQNSMRRGGW
jgi:transposase